MRRGLILAAAVVGAVGLLAALYVWTLPPGWRA